jgi:hypothetical protein
MTAACEMEHFCQAYATNQGCPADLSTPCPADCVGYYNPYGGGGGSASAASSASSSGFGWGRRGGYGGGGYSRWNRWGWGK